MMIIYNRPYLDHIIGLKIIRKYLSKKSQSYCNNIVNNDVNNIIYIITILKLLILLCCVEVY